MKTKIIVKNRLVKNKKHNYTKKQKGGTGDKVCIGWFNPTHAEIDDKMSNVPEENKIYANKNISTNEFYTIISNLVSQYGRYSAIKIYIVLNIDSIYKNLKNVRNIDIHKVLNINSNLLGAGGGGILFIPKIQLRPDIPLHHLQRMFNISLKATPFILFNKFYDANSNAFLLTREIIDFDEKYPNLIDLSSIEQFYVPLYGVDMVSPLPSGLTSYSVMEEKNNRIQKQTVAREAAAREAAAREAAAREAAARPILNEPIAYADDYIPNLGPLLRDRLPSVGGKKYKNKKK